MIWLFLILLLPIRADAFIIGSYAGRGTVGGGGGGGGGGVSCSNIITGTSTCVGAGSFAHDIGACPTESSGSIDPNTDQSADNTGATDAGPAIGLAIADAVAASKDIKFTTPGTYKVDLTGTGNTWYSSTSTGSGIIIPANMKVECATGVTLKGAFATAHDAGILNPKNGGNTICGCDFQSQQTGSPPYAIAGVPGSETNQGNWQIYISGGGTYTIENNTFEKGWGDANVGIADNASAAAVNFQYNSCTANPYYCFVIDGPATGTVVNNNYVTEGILGTEWDGCNGSSLGTGIVFKNNWTNAGAGNCNSTTPSDSGCDKPGELNVEAYTQSSTCNYSGVTLGPGNRCDGNGSFSTDIRGGLGGSNSGTSNQAVITGNTLGTSCSCVNIGSGQSCP